MVGGSKLGSEEHGRIKRFRTERGCEGSGCPRKGTWRAEQEGNVEGVSECRGSEVGS